MVFFMWDFFLDVSKYLVYKVIYIKRVLVNIDENRLILKIYLVLNVINMVFEGFFIIVNYVFVVCFYLFWGGVVWYGG